MYIVYLNRRTGDYWQRRMNIRNWRAWVVEAKRFLLSPETEGREKEKALLRAFGEQERSVAPTSCLCLCRVYLERILLLLNVTVL